MEKKALLPPKYVTKEVAKYAVTTALKAVMLDPCFKTMLKRNHCHIVVLVPATEDARETNYVDYPDYPVQPYLLYQESYRKAIWENSYDEIALCKALQLWTGRNDGGTSVAAHLLFPGDTPYWGGVKREGIVVACSGVQPWFDKMISGIVADIIIGLAHDALVNDPDMKEGVNFLS